jgi:hydrogenase maturation protein HypF
VSDSNRLQVRLGGAVQGVGFRPFVYRLAVELGLRGWVSNSPQGVLLEVEGPSARLRQFLLRLEQEKPPLSSIQSLEASWLDAADYAGFEIRPSSGLGGKTALVLPDIATCAECLREVFDPSNRRFGYPFTNCTHCGPRFSIIQALPYDRPNTSMSGFAMCAQCQAEYENPTDRRFHAQPNACPACGPQLDLWEADGAPVAAGHEALLQAAEALRRGAIVAVKGLGGFHLVVAAGQDGGVQRLRQRKGREEKPFAVMFPSLDQVRQCCQTDEMEERLLRSAEAPIVLLHRRHSADLEDQVCPAVAPANPYLGVMLPYTPLHHLLLDKLGFAVVATSGNVSDEPICTDEHEALVRLKGRADLFLVHNRPIVRHVDDSIVRVILGREMLLRRARGYAPLPILLGEPAGTPVAATDPNEASGSRPVSNETDQGLGSQSGAILAVGAHLKNTVALAVGPQVFISQHIGDLENEAALGAFRRVINDFQRLYEAPAVAVAADLHPDYLSSRFAEGLGLPVVRVQHHHAHVLGCLAENAASPPALGVSWDGTGYGPDGTVWGGEFLRVGGESFQRVACVRSFRLPGGERAVKEPRRAALGLLYEAFGEAAFGMTHLRPVAAFQADELALLRQSLPRGLNAPVTSSMGRLFDAVAGLCGLRQVMRFEGQAAMELEFALEGMDTADSYPFPLCDWHGSPPASSPLQGKERGPGAPAWRADWKPLLTTLLADVEAGVPAGLISARFHNGLAALIVEVARRAGEKRVALTGGCFQNKYLLERAVGLLQAAGFKPYWPQRVPPNDGGVALGQVVEARRVLTARQGLGEGTGSDRRALP